MMQSARFLAVLLAALSAAVLLGGGPVSAAEGGSSGPYMRIFGGYSFLEAPNIQGDGISNGATGNGINRGDVDASGSGWGGLAGGYRWGPLRLEAMGSYESHKVDAFASPQFQYRDLGGTLRTDLNATPALDGSLKVFTGFLNAMLDIEFGQPIVPFFGAGIGFANARLDNVTGTSRGNSFKLADDSDTVLAFQALVGVAYKVTETFSAEIGYRFLTMNDPSFSGGGAGEFDLTVDSHQVWLGLRVNF